MLSSQQQFRIALKPFIVEHIEKFARAYLKRQDFLQDHGFMATNPSMDWLKSYGGKKEWSEFMACLREDAVEWLTLGLVRDPGIPLFSDTKIMSSHYDAVHNDSARYNRELREVKRETRLLYEKEKAQHLKGYSDDVDPTKKGAKYSLYKRLMKDELEPFGFSKSKTLSTSSHSIYAKPLNENWNFAFDIIKGDIKRPFDETFTLWFSYGIVHSSHIGPPNQDSPHMLFSNRLFYPTDVITAVSDYQNGETLSDLELFLLAHLAMYKNICEELEEVVLSFLKCESSLKCD